MRTENITVQLATAVFVLIGCAGFANAQAAGRGRGAAAPQPGGAAATQTYAVGDAVEIQAADGSWIAGTVTSIDPATGKYNVVLVNSMSGLAPASALRRVSAPSGAGPGAQGTPGAASAAGCGSQPMCMEVRNLAATITDFRLSTAGVNQIVDVTIRFVNKTAGPLAFGYVGGSGTIIDDEGNRYNINENTIRGMGVVRGDTADAKFVLQAGDNGEALFQFTFTHGQEMLGTAYELDLTVREMTPSGGNQYTVGSEYPLRFAGAGQTSMSPGTITAEGAPATSSKTKGATGTTPGAKGSAAAGAGGTSATGGGGSSVVSGLSQVATLIPGFRGAPAATGPAGNSAAAKTAQAAPAAGQAATAFAPQAGTAVAPQVANTAGGLATVIPGFSGGAAPAATSTVASTAATLIPGFSAPAPAAAVPGFSAPAPAAPLATAIPAVAAAPVNPCAGQTYCFNAGPFAAQVSQLVGTLGATGYILRAQVVVKNVSAQAVTLGYVGRSASATDNLGNRFGPAMNGAAEQSVAGMGTVGTPQAGAFVLNPGQARVFSVAVVRPEAVKTAVGTAFNLNIQVSEMGIVAGRGAPVRAFPVSFAGVACQACAAVPAAVTAGAAGASGNAAANALRNLIRK